MNRLRGRQPIFSPPLPVVMGHRGARRVAPENTPEAFVAAGERGASWVELDVRLSADGVPIVVHDAETDDGLPVANLGADALRRRGLPLLSDVLRDLPGGMGADVEIKHRRGEPGWDPDAAIGRACAPIVATCLGVRPLVVTSFDPDVIDVVMDYDGAIPAGLLTGVLTSVASGLSRALELGCDVLAPHYSAPGLSPEGIATVKDHNLQMLVWTVNGSWRARRLAMAGVDAICTDDVVGTVRALGRPPPPG